MKWLISSLLIFGLFTLLLPIGHSQESQGAVAFVNAVALEKPTEILVNGTSIKPDGFDMGRMTSFIAIPASSTEIKAKNGDIPSKPLVSTPSPSGSSIFVVFLTETIGKDGEKEQELRTLSVPCSQNKNGFNQRIVLVGQDNPASFVINGQSLTLVPSVPSKGVESGEVKIETPSGQLVGVSASGEVGNFLIVVFPDLKGGYTSTSIRDNMIVFSPGG